MVRLRRIAKPTQRSLYPRIYLCLLDRQPHLVSEFYKWIAEVVFPVSAVREMQRTRKKVGENLEETISEGRRIIIYRAFCRLKARGSVKFDLPDKEPPRPGCTVGYHDPSKIVMQLTDKGYEYAMSRRGVFGPIASELYLGLVANRLKITTTYLGSPVVSEFSDEESSAEVEVSSS